MKTFILDYLKNGTYKGLSSKIRKNTDYIEAINNIIKEDISLSEKIYWIIHDIKEHPMCPICKKERLKFKDMNIGYFRTCSRACSGKDSLAIKKSRKTSQKNCGKSHWSQTAHAKKVLKNKLNKHEVGFTSPGYKAYLENNNVKNVSQIPEVNAQIRKTISEKDEQFWINRYEKTKKTLLKKYGVEHCVLLHKMFTYKDYILPSGKSVKVQGYEPIILDYMFKSIGIDENDLYIHKGVPKFNYKYDSDMIRTYYPDFYHKRTNTIVEVKSIFTYERHYKKNIEKMKAVKKAGYNFEFWFAHNKDIFVVNHAPLPSDVFDYKLHISKPNNFSVIEIEELT